MLASIMTVTMALVPTVQASDITVKVNGEEIHPEMAPVIVEERTLVPLRAIRRRLDVTCRGRRYKGYNTL